MDAKYEEIVAAASELTAEAEYDACFEALSTVYRLGGASALVLALKPYDDVACVRCGGNGEDPELRYPIADPSTLRGSGLFVHGPVPMGCSLCGSSGIISRAVIALVK